MTPDRQLDRYSSARARHHAATMAHRVAVREVEASAAELVAASAALVGRVQLLESTRPAPRRKAA